MPKTTDDPSAVADAALIDAVTRVLARALRQLGKTGHPSEAATLAAEAWSLLRHRFPDDAERLNGTMHYLSRVEQKLEALDRNQ